MPANDCQLYDRHAGRWWNERHPFARSLHAITPYRLGLINAAVGGEIAGLRVLDVGCGGGLLTRPLAAAGARVVALDRSHPSLRALGRGNGRLRLRADTAALPVTDGWADLVCACDVLEHVDHWPRLLARLARVLRPGGALVVTTLNHTRRARFLAVGVAEGLGLIPRGTHDHRRFIRPSWFSACARAAGFDPPTIGGERLLLWPTLRRWAIHVEAGSDTALGWSAVAYRPSQATASMVQSSSG